MASSTIFSLKDLIVTHILVIYLGDSFLNEQFNKWYGRLKCGDHVQLPGDSDRVELQPCGENAYHAEVGVVLAYFQASDPIHFMTCPELHTILQNS